MSKNLFNSVKMTRPQTNVFDLTHDVKLSCDMGTLVPICLMECVPGDKFHLATESLIRFAPLISPVMHRMNVFMHYFFVPNRLVWPNWERFITNGGDEPFAANTSFPYVTIKADGSNYGQLADYLGVPNPSIITGTTDLKISAIPFAAYHKIYNEYYRDQNLASSFIDTCLDGNNAVNETDLFGIHERAWEHDYFTSCLPFAQKGESVSIPLGDVTLKDPWGSGSAPFPSFKNFAGGQYADATSWLKTAVSGSDTYIGVNGDSAQNYAYDPAGSLSVSATTINDLRRAFRLQEWLEKNARGGTRYTENILVHFGVHSSDKRLQRPEYITGSASPVVISEVLNTTGTDTLPQGNMAGHAVSVTAGHQGSYFCEEHGYIIGIMSIMPKTAYFQGIERSWTKFEPTDYFWPSFANIGEQEVLNKELYAFREQGDDVFGYVPRYAEYKFMSNRVAGDFRSTLDFWHMARKFSTPPNLDITFVQADPTTRIFAVEDGVQHMYCHILNKVKAIRGMPKYGNPSF